MKQITFTMDEWLFSQIEANKGKNRSAYLRGLVTKGLGIKLPDYRAAVLSGGDNADSKV